MTNHKDLSRLQYFIFGIILIFFIGSAAFSKEAVPVDPDLIVLLSDIHIVPKDFHWEYARHNDRKLDQNLDRIIQMNPRPAHVLILGDLSFNDGLAEDYQLVKQLFQKLDQANIPWTGTMGNHDQYENFIKAFPDKKSVSGIPNKAVYAVELKNAVFILLDSMIPKNVGGDLDEKQLNWLKSTLEKEQSTGRQIFVGAHHTVHEMRHSGEFSALLRQFPRVQAYVHGHSHRWTIYMDQGIPVMNVPSTAYISKKVADSPTPDDWPLGFMTLKIGSENNIFTLFTNKDSHSLNRIQWIVPVRK